MLPDTNFDVLEELQAAKVKGCLLVMRATFIVHHLSNCFINVPMEETVLF